MSKVIIERDAMLTLYQFNPVWGLPNSSPFCMKLETYLRMARIEYQVNTEGNLSKAPKGKLPYIEDQGQIIADSNLIIDYLQSTYGTSLDTHLSPAEAAVALALRRLVEENLYWAVVYSRWVEEQNWPSTRAIYFEELPPILRTLVAYIARRQVTQNLKGHGMGRHSAAEIYQISAADLQALSDFLADKPYFMGDQPTTLDASAYGVLANILKAPLNSPLRDKAEQLSNLGSYCDRMYQTYYA